MKCRKVRAVIRYHTPNKAKEPEKYFHHLLILYHPWRQQTELLGEEKTYMSKFNVSDVQTIVQRNRNIFEDSEAVIEALESLRKSKIRTSYSFDPINDQENYDVQFDIANSSYEESFYNQMSGDQLFSSNEQIPRAMSTYIQVSEICDDDLR